MTVRECHSQALQIVAMDKGIKAEDIFWMQAYKDSGRESKEIDFSIDDKILSSV